MASRRRLHFGPRRLRWRLVIGFALTVAVLLALLTVVERLLLEQALVQSVRQSLESTVRAGQASTLLRYDANSTSALLAKVTGTSLQPTPGIGAAPDPSLPDLAYVARVLGVTMAQLLHDLAAGKTLLQSAPRTYPTAGDLATALLVNVRIKLDSAVARGGMTRAQMNAEYVRLHRTYERLVVSRHPPLSMPSKTLDTGMGTAVPTATATTSAVPSATPIAGGRPPNSTQIVAKENISLLLALDVTAQLPMLTNVLALPDQPVAMLDAQGRVLDRTASLAQDKTRAHPLAPAVLSSLLRQARPHTPKLSGEWSQQVSTPDGPYLLLLQQTGEPVLAPQPTKKEVVELASVLRGGPKALTAPASQARRVHGRTSRLVVLIARRLGETQQTVQTVTVISLGGALAVILLATLLSLLVVGRALRPLSAITQGAERIAQGDYRHRVNLDAGTDEVGRLGAAFDRMAAAIATAFATQRRFVADASHELRTPLTALRGYTDILLLGVGEDRNTAERVLGAMQEDLGRMSRLVDDLLMLARLDGASALQMAPIRLSDLLSAAAGEGRAISGGAQRIVDHPVPGEILVWGDRDRLRQVLSNVMANACAYCPPGSTIALHVTADQRWVSVEVQDDGPGILPSDLARLGERFYRGDAARSRRTGGTGLGLAIARTIVEAHGGALSIESTLGAGTTVSIRLPLWVR